MSATVHDAPVPNARRVQVLRAQLEAAHDAIERLIVERDAALAALEMVGDEPTFDLEAELPR